MKLRLLLFFSLLPGVCMAQDFEFGKFLASELGMKSYAPDTSANAVVLHEFGDTFMSSGEGTPLVYKYHVKIKIFNKEGFNQGDVVIPVYKSDNNRFESVSEISGITISPGPNGEMKRTNLDPKKVYRENKNSHWDVVKFAMPNLAEGCIIEYSYEITKPYIFNFQPWVFQSEIPKVHSEYMAHIPAMFNYNVSLRGLLKLSKTDAQLEKECFTPGGGIKVDCSKMTYIMTNVPALVEEDYMTSPNNFRSAIYFELADYQNYEGTKIKVTKDWKAIDVDLQRHDAFGAQIKKGDLFKDKLTPVLAGKTAPLSKAKAIYAYLQKWYKWNGFDGIYSMTGIRKAYESHTGSSGDINLALVAALSYAGLDAEAVLLSTRENGFINKLYPVLSDFDYVVAQVNIDGKSYMLDATDPLLPFGLLPFKCINDQGRVISRNKPSYWIDMTAAEKKSRTLNLDLTINDNGKITGALKCYSKGYEAYNKRRAIKKFNSVEEYVENLDEKMPRIKLLKSQINNIDSLDLALEEIYEVQIDAFSDLNTGSFSFNPFFMEAIRENPFKLKERTYPVDMGSPSDYRIQMSLRFPERFEVASKPAPIGLALPLSGGRYTSETNIDGNQLVYTQITQFNKSVYSNEEYSYLKEMYNRIIQTQKTDIVFRKKL
ncbi:DUF3857 domain-containing protein [Hufsiella ginkgonis]|uniref:DUF3857 domain-containing protein n=1 Tax=Hufsiella ginkgonis TaxID=2695274 RepID=A0A7K1XWI3_9SPHI|nr:DUF3857 domain-containing protein [Hufsiella ginkgonis]MXV15320.1 DUF3857 domain-containing protein [Hufsiella ginkgonis]